MNLVVRRGEAVLELNNIRKDEIYLYGDCIRFAHTSNNEYATENDFSCSYTQKVTEYHTYKDLKELYKLIQTFDNTGIYTITITTKHIKISHKKEDFNA
jgi:hypothetical protein